MSSTEPPDDVVRLLRSEPVPPSPDPAPNVSDAEVPDLGGLPSWPTVETTEFRAAYPFAEVDYLDPGLPVAVSLSAFTPFVPLDADASSLPLVPLPVHPAPTPAPSSGTVSCSAPCRTGSAGTASPPSTGPVVAGYGGNVNRLVRRPGQTGVLMDNPSLRETDEGYGEMLLWTDAPALALPRAISADALLRFAETVKLVTPVQLGDFSDAALRAALADGASPMKAPAGPSPAGFTWDAGLAAAFALAPGETTTIDIVHAWWFPNRFADFDRFGPTPSYAGSRFWVGNHYATRFGGAVDVLDAYLADRDHLDAVSRQWASAIADSDLPSALKEVISAQGTLVRSPSLFRTADGRAYGFEGALGASTRNWNGDVGGSCPLNCNHVFNYEQALARLFPALGRDMRRPSSPSRPPTGRSPIGSPCRSTCRNTTTSPSGPVRPALDGMLGAVLKTYRSVLDGSGPDWLRDQWLALRRLMEHITRTWDPDGTGILRGDQPCTYDISLHGPNMFVGGLWPAALRAMEEMARLAEPALAAGFAKLFAARARRLRRTPVDGRVLRPARHRRGARLRPGAACPTSSSASGGPHQLDLGHILPPDRVRTALSSIVRYNLRTGFEPHGYREFADGTGDGPGRLHLAASAAAPPCPSATATRCGPAWNTRSRPAACTRA